MRYSKTPDEIALMNPFQQLVLIDVDPQRAETIQFQNMDEFLAWKMSGGQ